MPDRWPPRKHPGAQAIRPIVVYRLLHRRCYSNGRWRRPMGWNCHGTMGSRPGSWRPVSTCTIVHGRNLASKSERSSHLVRPPLSQIPNLSLTIILADATNSSSLSEYLQLIASTLALRPAPTPVHTEFPWALDTSGH
jgi:hypothetical protein